MMDLTSLPAIDPVETVDFSELVYYLDLLAQEAAKQTAFLAILAAFCFAFTVFAFAFMRR